MQDYIEIELTKRDGTKVYEIVSREDARRETYQMMRLHDAVKSEGVDRAKA